MREIFGQKELPATELEIRKAVEDWWNYLGQKVKVHPHLAKGIVPRLVDEGGLQSEATRTVKFSLVDTMAPELSGLGRLVNAKEPHVYVEGIRNSDIVVEFEEMYPNLFEETFFKPGNKKLPRYLAETGIQPDRFYLHIYTADDIGNYGRVYENVTVRKLVFLNGKDGKMSAIDIGSGWRRIGIGTTANISIDKVIGINTATQSQIEIIQKSFRDAISQLSLVE